MKNETMERAGYEIIQGGKNKETALKYGIDAGNLSRYVKKMKERIEAGEEIKIEINETPIVNETPEKETDVADTILNDLKKTTLKTATAGESAVEAVGQASVDAGCEKSSIASPAVCSHNCETCKKQMEEEQEKLNKEYDSIIFEGNEKEISLELKIKELEVENISLKETTEQVPAFLEKLQTAESSAGMLQARIDELNNEKSKLENEVKNIDELNNRVRVAESDVSSIREEMQVLQESNQGLLSEKAILEQDVDAKESLIKTAKKELEEKLNEIITIKNERDSMEKQWLSVSEESKTMGQQLAGTKKALEDMQKERLQEFKRANENQGIITTKERELNELKESIESEKKRIEDDCMKIAQKAVNSAGASKIFMMIVIFLGMPGACFLTYKTLQVIGRLA